MTTTARVPSPQPPPYELDVRCSATFTRKSPDEGRCQLFAGHDGPHAVMFSRRGKRTVRNWTAGAASEVTTTGTDALRRPWMFGYPAPAWYEPVDAAPPLRD